MILEFELAAETRLDTGISREYPQFFSRAHAQKLIKDGFVNVNGISCKKSSHKSEVPIRVTIQYEPPEEYELKANASQTIPILYQDKYLAIIHKPAGVTVHPGAGTKEDTLVHILLSQIDQLSDGSEKLRPGIVHRLDRETEGLMVVAKDNHTHFELARSFSERKVTKEYHSWVWGGVGDYQEIEGFIGRHPTERKKMLFEYSKVNETYKEASMAFEKNYQNSFGSLIRIQLFTGRTHQIRATMTKLDHPVIGDLIYSRFQRRLEKAAIPGNLKEIIKNGGLFLIASRLSFVHPVLKETMDFHLPLPERFIMLKE